MRSARKSILFLVLFCFGVLSIKGLFVSFSSQGSCQEFAHLHLYKIKSFKSQSQNGTASQTFIGLSDEDSQCHDGKALASLSLLPVLAVTFESIPVEFNFEVIHHLKNQFGSPYLDPLRRPPRDV